MTNFERIGIAHQDDADTVEDARKAFADSCQRCAYKGRPMDCETCAIAQWHPIRIEILEAVAENREDFNKLRRGEIDHLPEA